MTAEGAYTAALLDRFPLNKKVRVFLLEQLEELAEVFFRRGIGNPPTSSTPVTAEAREAVAIFDGFNEETRGALLASLQRLAPCYEAKGGCRREDDKPKRRRSAANAKVLQLSDFRRQLVEVD
jgi:hypothetical protein